MLKKMQSNKRFVLNMGLMYDLPYCLIYKIDIL